MKRNSFTQFIYVIILLSGMLANTFVYLGAGFLSEKDNIELSELFDFDGEENEEKFEKDTQEKVKYESVITPKNIVVHCPNSFYFLTTNSNCFRKIFIKTSIYEY